MKDRQHEMTDLTRGMFTATDWAKALYVSPGTVRDWIERYSIPHYRPGRESVIDAADFWKAVGKQTPGAKR